MCHVHHTTLSSDSTCEFFPYLAEIHDNGFMHFLPQVSTEYLDQRDLERWDLAMHKYAS
jgi:hypothetical protein